MSQLEKIRSREECRQMMATWVRSLMINGQMTPTAFAVSLTVSFQRIYGDGTAYDHDRQRLFKSCVSKWKKGVQSPSLDNCRVLDDVRKSIESELVGLEEADVQERLTEIRKLAQPSIVDLRAHLDTLPRERHSARRATQGSAMPNFGLEEPMSATIRTLLTLLREAARDTQLRLEESPAHVSDSGEPRSAPSNGLNGKKSPAIKREANRQLLTQQIGELVLTLLEEQKAQDLHP